MRNDLAPVATDTGDADRPMLRVETGAKRVRAMLAGVTVFDTRRPLLVWESPRYPTYYVPAADVDAAWLHATGRTERSPSRGEAELYTLAVGDQSRDGAVRRYPESGTEAIRDAYRFDWAALDAWYEEDEEVFTHPRDPYHRIDILHSSRHVEILVDGTVVAESRRPTLLFETGLPVRYYLPLTDIRPEYLRSSSTASSCPYKGTASYWSLEVDGRRHEDAVWTYVRPLPESAKIAGLASFYNERVDIRVDGELQERPQSPFSRRL